MWPPACSSVPAVGPAVGVVTVLVALLEAESDEQLAMANKLVSASRETEKRYIRRKFGVENQGPSRRVRSAAAALAVAGTTRSRRRGGCISLAPQLSLVGQKSQEEREGGAAEPGGRANEKAPPDIA